MLTFSVITPASGEARISGTVGTERFNVKFTDAMYASLNTAQEELEDVEDIDAYDIWEKKVISMVNNSAEGDIVTSACKDLMLDQKTGNYYVKVGTVVSKFAVPSLLVDVILKSVEKSIDPTPIVKAWIRFLRNVNFTERKGYLFARYITSTIVDEDELTKLMDEEGYTFEKATDRASYNDVAITNEGLIVTKKYAKLLTKGWVIDPKTNEAVLEDLFKTTKTVDQFSGDVTETTDYPEFAEELTFEPPLMHRSGDEFFCGDKKDHVIKVGQLHELEKWSQVNTNDDTSCVKGLHVGGWKYVSNYSSLNAQLLECFVDPADIGAICDINDYGSDGAIRCKAYFVYGAVSGRTKGIYHSSKYAAMRDDLWEQYKKDAVESANKLEQAVSNFDVN